ncbi:MAG TPA: DoxX family protein [Verrucomicrobiales bacterium]|nr:DoxX family protein [Verrucomicrobiales bacterium]HCN77493.1 DoxX family protein [Verrucomicrobiales bacterium]HRJ07069.1 DoxX family protein [Prosthecobacter sp.]HRK13163.1 DoxX family protein [Prosthecobacter sp.]
MLNILRLSFLSGCSDLGLLVLRVSLGFTMLLLHGWKKFENFSEIAPGFLSLFGLPSHISLGLAVFAEVVCSVLLIVGLFTRFAALNLAVTMAVAFFIAHGGAFAGDKPGELAFVYLTGYLALVFTGAGKYSADGR